MIETIETLNLCLALGGVLAFVGASILLVDLYSSKIFANLIRMWGLMLAFIATVSASIMTLVYSEIFGFVPCGLCWLQRVFLYPQVLLLGAALFYKDKTAARYGVVLSIPGLVIALYQHYLQMGGSELVACPTAGAGTDCAKRFLFEFGFMTFPLLSAALFAFLIILYLYMLKVRESA